MPRLDDLQGHLAADGLLLLGDEDQAHAALADLLHQLVRPDHRAGPLTNGLLIGRGDRAGADFPMSLQERFHAAAQVRLAGAGPVQERRPFGGGVLLEGLDEDRFFRHGNRPPAGFPLLPLHATSR